jgi:hypothetical protein
MQQGRATGSRAGHPAGYVISANTKRQPPERVAESNRPPVAKVCSHKPMSKTEIQVIAEFVSVESGDKNSAGLKSFTFRDFTIHFRNHSYVVLVKGLRVNLDKNGVWSATYKVENSQWRGGVQISMGLLRAGTEPPERRELAVFKADFPLACHMASLVTGGAYNEGLFDLAEDVLVRVGGTGASVCL